MTGCKRAPWLTTLCSVLALSAMLPGAGRAEPAGGELDAVLQTAIGDYVAAHPETIERIVKDYLVSHPEVLQASLLELLKRRKPTVADSVASKAAIVKANAPALFESAHQVTIGNPKGAVTMVEFFDYNCGFCKRALADTLSLMKSDPNLRIVLKEFPILGSGSLEAARVAVAVRMQDPGGERYLAFHQKLLSGRGPANQSTAIDAAREAGLDVATIERDMASDDVQATLGENARLAKDLGITGTPGYVVGDNVIVGAVGLAALDNRIKAAAH